VLGALAVLFAAPARALEPGEDPGPLPWRVGGGLSFTLDAAAFPDSTGGGILEVYARIPPRTLSRLADAEDGSSRLKLTIKLRTRYGGKQHEASQELTVAAADTGGSFGKVMVMRFPSKPGTYRVEVRLEDVLSRKRGIAYLGRKVTQAVAVEGEIAFPAPAAGIAVSDPEFVWPGTGPESAAFRRGGRILVPNAERLYGLYATALEVAFQARGTAGPGTWNWKARILDAQGHAVAEQDSVADPAPVLNGATAVDVSTMPAGIYTFELEVRSSAGGAPVLRRAPFEIAWRGGSWNRDPDEIEDEVHFLFESEGEKTFKAMGPGAREAALDRFWLDRDPDPGTGENEARTAFLARIEHANRTWTRAGIGKGMYSDMGRTFIRHGEPDEILRQVMPAGDQTVAQVLQSLDLTESRPTGAVDQKGIGGDTRPFEIWVYDFREKRPLTAPRGAVINEKQRRSMLFLFVDEQGYGDFRLRYSTD
jgi:GWxTD domain-containing protein